MVQSGKRMGRGTEREVEIALFLVVIIGKTK